MRQTIYLRKGCIKMSKKELVHELYEICKGISIDEADDLVIQAESTEEKGFIRILTDYVLQQKQKKVVAEKRF